MNYACDFETTTEKEDCRVWAAGIYDIESGAFKWMTNIKDFMDYVYTLGSCKLYFHNLKFDGEFILYYLLTNGFKYVDEVTPKNSKEFSTNIGEFGQFYSITIKYKKSLIRIWDSLKVLPMKIEEMPKAFGLDIEKLELDYTKKRDEKYIVSEEELRYLYNDCKILALSLRHLFNMGLTSITLASNAFRNFKKDFTNKEYARLFPPPYYDADMRQAYKGGYVYVNPKFKNKRINSGIVLDVNSMYPWAMKFCKLPYGEPIYFEGKYEFDEVYCLYIQQFVCRFKLKKGKLPMIQIKGNLYRFNPTEYLDNSGDQEVCLTLTNVDLELFLECYEIIGEIEYIAVFIFKGKFVLLLKFVDRLYSLKKEATWYKNTALRTIAKLMLNSLYGKFAVNPKVRSKYPILHDNTVKYLDGEINDREPIYIPIAAFITSYARDKLIRAALNNLDRFIYCDTDSLHLTGEEIPEGLELDDIKLGAFKIESKFSSAKFIRAKTYIEIIRGEKHIKCAGMPANLYDQVSFNDFRPGAEYSGKLRPIHVPGGIVLEPTVFTIRG